MLRNIEEIGVFLEDWRGAKSRGNRILRHSGDAEEAVRHPEASSAEAEVEA